MNTTHHYVVLRLAPDPMRGEVINAGIVLFSPDAQPRVITMATLNKLRALDATWDTARLVSWSDNIQKILNSKSGISKQVQALSMFGFCEAGAVGMFTAETPSELARQVQLIKTTYVSNKASEKPSNRPRRTRLQKALRDQFKSMHVLGVQAADLAEHLVVPNVPVPGHDDLRTDFVYKNGVYRLTQTLDYNIAPDSMHHKLAEACLKTTAVDLATEVYGHDALRLAVVDVPEVLAGAADAHIDLLLHKGFEVFHFGDQASMAKYMSKAVPSIQQ